MDKMKWLEPSIESAIERVAIECDVACVEYIGEVYAALYCIRSRNHPGTEQELIRIENAILSLLQTAANTAYRSGFTDAIRVGSAHDLPKNI